MALHFWENSEFSGTRHHLTFSLSLAAMSPPCLIACPIKFNVYKAIHYQLKLHSSADTHTHTHTYDDETGKLLESVQNKKRHWICNSFFLQLHHSHASFARANVDEMYTDLKWNTPDAFDSQMQFPFEWPAWPLSIRMAIIKFVLHTTRSTVHWWWDRTKTRIFIQMKWKRMESVRAALYALAERMKLFHFECHKIVNCINVIRNFTNVQWIKCVLFELIPPS